VRTRLGMGTQIRFSCDSKSLGAVFVQEASAAKYGNAKVDAHLLILRGL